jgi:hypothetical protein
VRRHRRIPVALPHVARGRRRPHSPDGWACCEVQYFYFYICAASSIVPPQPKIVVNSLSIRHFFCKNTSELLRSFGITTHPRKHENYIPDPRCPSPIMLWRGMRTRRCTSFTAPSRSGRNFGLCNRMKHRWKVVILGYGRPARRRCRLMKKHRSSNVISLTDKQERGNSLEEAKMQLRWIRRTGSPTCFVNVIISSKNSRERRLTRSNDLRAPKTSSSPPTQPRMPVKNRHEMVDFG